MYNYQTKDTFLWVLAMVDRSDINAAVDEAWKRASTAGTQSGGRRLPEGIEVVISEAIEDFFKSRQKPSNNALHKVVRRRCVQQGFLLTVERMVRRDGIHLYSLRNWDDVLCIWAGRKGRQLRVSYDPRDVSTVFVRVPDGHLYPVRFADLRHPPITLAEHLRAQTVLRERGRSLEDENLIFAMIEGNETKYAESGDILNVPLSTWRNGRERGRGVFSRAGQGRGAGGVQTRHLQRALRSFSGRLSGSSMVARINWLPLSGQFGRYGHRLIGWVQRVLSWHFGSTYRDGTGLLRPAPP